ncbi:MULTISPECIES: hypothetical protein [Sphingobacterium]|uniref:hypothetical protein n=1 Tax=Sphingobacterium TaxID=28453 RepID=UPI00162AE689|nr:MULTISPECIES: hypothetical protein [Sphingobacterium]
METPLPIKDLILFRLYTGKPIFELEIFENFTEDLTFLLEEKMIIPLNKPLQYDYPYDFELTERGIKHLFR